MNAKAKSSISGLEKSGLLSYRGVEKCGRVPGCRRSSSTPRDLQYHREMFVMKEETVTETENTDLGTL